MSLCVSDWMKLNCGDEICRKEDPRHVGRVVRIENSAIVHVRWECGLGEEALEDIARKAVVWRAHGWEM